MQQQSRISDEEDQATPGGTGETLPLEKAGPQRTLPDKNGKYSELIVEQVRDKIFEKYTHKAGLTPIQNYIDAQLKGFIDGGSFLGGMGGTENNEHTVAL